MTDRVTDKENEVLDGITIDGYEVLTRKQEARNNAEECYNQAAYYSRVASECIISSIGNHFYELANTYRGYVVSWERIEDALHKIENQYDDIDYDSSILFKDIAERLGTNPDDLMAIMAFDSNGINPYCENDSGYFGLIQFGDMAIQTINSKYECNYTKEEILSMTPTEQLEVVYLNFAWQLRDKSQKYTLSDLYMTVIWPDAVEK